MGARSYSLLITKQLIINQLDKNKGKGASGAGEAPIRWRRTRAIRSRRRPSPYTFLTTTLHHQSLPHHFQPGPKHSPRHSRPDRESLPRLPAPAILSHHYPTSPNCRTSAPAWRPCLAYRGAPQAEIGPRRRSFAVLAQVGFLGLDLRHHRAQNRVSRRRSPPFFLTCANNRHHLRPK